jgi:hypothetical protein
MTKHRHRKQFARFWLQYRTDSSPQDPDFVFTFACDHIFTEFKEHDFDELMDVLYDSLYLRTFKGKATGLLRWFDPAKYSGSKSPLHHFKTQLKRWFQSNMRTMHPKSHRERFRPTADVVTVMQNRQLKQEENRQRSREAELDAIWEIKVQTVKLLDAISKLPAAEDKMLHERYWEGKPIREIAEARNRTPKQVLGDLERVYKDLRNQLSVKE